LICPEILQYGIKGLPRLTLQEAEKHTSLSRHSPRKQKRISSYPSVVSHFIDSEPLCLREEIGEQAWKDVITEEYKYILKNDV
jgi:hypothetical protein